MVLIFTVKKKGNVDLVFTVKEKGDVGLVFTVMKKRSEKGGMCSYWLYRKEKER